MSQNTDKVAKKVGSGLESILQNWNNGSPMGQSIELPEGVMDCFKRHIQGQLAAFAPELDKVPQDDPRLKP